MVKYMKYFSLIMIIAAVIFSGCSDRGTNIPASTQVDPWGLTDKNFVFAPPDNVESPQLIFQIQNPFGLLQTAIYVPKSAYPPPDGVSQPVPLLILLAPQDGDEFFYFEHGLMELADEMIATGEIEPMTICCISNDHVFGGYFYGNSFPAGFYDEVIGSLDDYRLLDRLYNDLQFPASMQTADKRGIGGIGQGAYGAFRACIKHPGVFSSLSVADGPLDFDGSDGNSGLINLMDDALLEQGLLSGNIKQFDTSSAWPISRMFIGGALAFSPHDTAIDYTLTFTSYGYSVTFLGRDTIADEATLVDSIIKDDNFNFDFHLPFDNTGAKYDQIWNLWMQNNLEDMYEAAGGTPLANLNMWVATSPEASNGYHDMTTSWIDYLQTAGYTPDVYTYKGYSGKPALKNEYVYDLLRKMLIFHDNNFKNTTGK